MHSIPPITATGLRFALAAPLLMLLAKYQKVDLLFPKGKGLSFVLITLFYFALPFTLMIFGEQYISSGLAAIIFGAMPVVVMVLSLLLYKQIVPVHQMVGVAIALVSLTAIISIEMGLGDGADLIGVVAMVSAVLMHATIYTTVQRRCVGMHVLTYNALPCVVAAVILLTVGWCVECPNMQSFTGLSLLAVAYLGIVAGLGGIVAYFQLNKLASPFQASICFLIFPVIALTLDSLINNRTISQTSLMMTGLLTLGVLLTKLPARQTGVTGNPVADAS